MREHLWLTGSFPGDRTDPSALVVHGHRRSRGPYTVGGAILREVVPEVLERAPAQVAAHDIEIRSVAPDLRDRVAARRQGVDAHIDDDERILVPAPRRTLRLANGVAEFLSACLRGSRTLVVTDVHEADPTDLELLAVLVRRLDPALLTMVLCSGQAPPPWFRGRVAGSGGPVPARVSAGPDGMPPDAVAAAHVASECTDEWSRAAYEALDPAERALLHDLRADELEAAGEFSARLGAVPFHREHGSDPRGRGAGALWTAVDHCVREGFLDAVAELGRRGSRLAEPGSDLWWRFIQRTATALGALSRQEEARDLYERARRGSQDPAVHAASAYGTAMLDARHPDPAQRDLGRATGWINQAVAISTLLPDRGERAFKLGFDRNGQALVETRLGRPRQALALVESAIELAQEDLPPGRHPVHRMVLHANRGRLLAELGRAKEALEEYSAAIALDPFFADHYLERGNLLFRLGLTDEALADYEAAIRVSPPLPEAYYNRAELRLALGDLEGGRADLDHVLELDPDYLDAYINRAGVRAVLGLEAEARADVAAGLALMPGNPHLLTVKGQLDTASGRFEEAARAFDTALESAPALGAAWANRGILRYETGDAEGAVTDLSRAIEIEESPELYFNRATALQALGREQAAQEDLRHALDLDPDDPAIREALGL
ncbi:MULTISPECIES: tetratricopeptide repeat protein [Streptosporangium]|uniref:Tetratricopeptide (TPR) repeat protein n=1 Tax=Streptosporangium brasiliense TaxID=47480 RepID=A0ABT9RA49_9ACTN|nr:tetratricopeptide repeat protein [Streptosporangium brasiliense]MDP9866098.1 tetratricopeptide (TPR) repeat protein [Streptosporangium brasiliense]